MKDELFIVGYAKRYNIPIFGIASTNNHFDYNLICFGFRDRCILDSNFWALGHNSLFHCRRHLETAAYLLCSLYV